MRNQPLDPNHVISDEWTVVAGGPSIAKLDLEAERLDGPVIAINHAFYRFPEATDIWAGFDQPVSMLERMPDPSATMEENVRASKEMLAKHRPIIWCRYRHEKHWRKKARGVVDDLEIHPWHLRLGGGPKPEQIAVPWKSQSVVDWSQGTLMITLGLLMRQKPKRVRVLGCDQEGVGGWSNQNGTQWPPRHRTPAYQGQAWWERRWQREGKALRSAIGEAGSRGIEIDWVRPERWKCNPVQVEGVPT